MIQKFILAIVLILWATIASALEFHPSPLNLSHGTWGSDHEKTHTVNSKLRMKFGGNCFYIAKDNTYVQFAKTPREITLSKVAANCKHKGSIFGLYMKQMTRHWNDTPLYTLDEWVSYTNGSISYMRSEKGSANHSLTCMFEMAYYSYEAVQLMPDTYEDKQNLQQFWVWLAKRNIATSQQAETDDMSSAKQKEWRDIVKSLLPQDLIRIEQPKKNLIRIEQPKKEDL